LLEGSVGEGFFGDPRRMATATWLSDGRRGDLASRLENFPFLGSLNAPRVVAAAGAVRQ